jgi:hypothetical protein
MLEYNGPVKLSYVQAVFAVLPHGTTERDFEGICHILHNKYCPVPDRSLFFLFPSKHWPVKATLEYIEAMVPGKLIRKRVTQSFKSEYFLDSQMEDLMAADDWNCLMAKVKTYEKETRRKRATYQMCERLPPSYRLEYLESVHSLYPLIGLRSLAAKSPEYVDFVVNAWNIGSRPTRNTTRTFNNRLDEMLRSACEVQPTPGAFYSPYCTIVQSSGAGKSKFLLGQKKIDVRRRRHCLMVVIHCENDANVKHEFGVNNIFGYDVVRRLIEDNRHSGLLGGDLAALRLAIYGRISERAGDGSLTLRPAYRECGGVLIEQLFRDEDDLVAAIAGFRDVRDDVSIFLGGNSVVVAVAFDEAHYLLKGAVLDNNDIQMQLDAPKRIYEYGEVNYFRHVRRALRHVFPKFPVFLASTYSNISNFMPTRDAKSSARSFMASERQMIAYKLHEPIVLQETFDIFAVDAIEAAAGRDLFGYVATDEYLEGLAMFGRPLWGAIMKGAGADARQKLEFVLSHCRAKLQLDGWMEEGEGIGVGRWRGGDGGMGAGEDRPVGEDRLRAESECLAVLFLTIYLDPLMTLEYGSLLVKWRNGYLYRFSAANGQFIVGYISEPVMSMVATALLMVERERPGRYLGNLCRLATHGNVDVGARGEAGVRARLLVAQQSAGSVRAAGLSGPLSSMDEQLVFNRTVMTAHPRTVRGFLESLVGAEAVGGCWMGAGGGSKDCGDDDGGDDRDGDDDGDGDDRDGDGGKRDDEGLFLEGRLVFNHFTRMEEHLQERKDFRYLLASAALRCAALIPPSNEASVDAILPVLCADGSTACILVQVKNERSFRMKRAERVFEGMDGYARSRRIQRCCHLLFDVGGGDRIMTREVAGDEGRRHRGFFIKGFPGDAIDGFPGLKRAILDICKVGRHGLFRTKQDCDTFHGPLKHLASVKQAMGVLDSAVSGDVSDDDEEDYPAGSDMELH